MIFDDQKSFLVIWIFMNRGRPGGPCPKKVQSPGPSPWFYYFTAQPRSVLPDFFRFQSRSRSRIPKNLNLSPSSGFKISPGPDPVPLFPVPGPRGLGDSVSDELPYSSIVIKWSKSKNVHIYENFRENCRTAVKIIGQHNSAMVVISRD